MSRHISLRRHRGLRTRITLAFALGALALAATLSIATYLLAERYLLDQQQQAAMQQAYSDATLVRERLTRRPDEPAAALEQLGLSPATKAAFAQKDNWYSTSIELDPSRIPDTLKRTVGRDQAGRQRIQYLGNPHLAVGIALPAVRGAYYEVLPLRDLQETLGVIRNTLLAAAIVTTLGAALVGLRASRRVLQPVLQIRSAAERIAGGDLSARLERQADPDLDRVVVSFNSMTEALERRIERDTRFVSDVSHELRSPLTTLAAAADVLEARSAEVPPRSRDALRLVVDEVHRFQQMVEELLELSRAQAGADPLRLEPVRLGELVRHVADRFGGRPFVVDVEPAVTRDEVMVDKRRVERVLVNLLENARDHGGGVVAVHAGRDNGTAWMSIDDGGPGVPEPERALIFERFARGNKAGAAVTPGEPGWGLRSLQST